MFFGWFCVGTDTDTDIGQNIPTNKYTNIGTRRFWPILNIVPIHIPKWAKKFPTNIRSYIKIIQNIRTDADTGIGQIIHKEIDTNFCTRHFLVIQTRI